MTLSNTFSLSRIILSALLVWCLHVRTLMGAIAALGVFVLASLTDYWDGWVARRRNEITPFGAFLDPLADKCLILAAFWSFVSLHLMPLWMVAVIMAREVAVTLARLVTLPQRVVPAIWSGKQKTVSQMVTAIVILVLLIIARAAQACGSPLAVLEAPLVRWGLWWLALWTTIITVLSGMHLALRWRRADAVSAPKLTALRSPAVVVATMGGAGFLPVAPGAWGSLAGLGLAYLLQHSAAWTSLAFLVGCAAACWTIPAAEQRLQHDDASQIVIDETLGMLLSLWGIAWRWSFVIAGFMGFRLLDVVKPFGIRRLERWPTPWGVLCDDLACGVVVNAALQVAMRLVR